MPGKRNAQNHDHLCESDCQDSDLEDTIEERISQLLHEKTKDVYFTPGMRRDLMLRLRSVQNRPYAACVPRQRDKCPEL